MIQFYAPDIASTLMLPESDSQHCIRVLRKQLGDEIVVVDGYGGRYRCRIVDPHQKHTGLEIIERENAALSWNYNVTVAVAPTKHLDRMEWLVEKLTEIGVNRIIPLVCDHSERRDLKIERLEKIAVSAMKQSLKAVLPKIDSLTSVDDVIDTVNADSRFIAYCDVSLPRKLLSREIKPHCDTLILIGPEGDFTPDEIRHALGAGFIPVSLGDNRLRTETAALVAVDTVHIVNQLDLATQYNPI